MEDGSSNFPIDPIEPTSEIHNPSYFRKSDSEKSGNSDKDDKEDDRDTIEISEEGRAAAETYQNQNTDEE